ncbi:hypothetical protein D3C86_1795180 [compost metagenome]
MAELVVDLLEVVQIHYQYAIAVAVPAMDGDGDLQFFIHRAAIARAGQWVLDRQDLQLVALATGAVGEDEGHGAGQQAGDQE